jgi:guanylate kinase
LHVRDIEGKICLLDIDVKGARDIHMSQLIECNYVFVNVPSIKELERRLLARKSETPESLARRLANAEKEIEFAKELGIFRKWLVNDTAE